MNQYQYPVFFPAHIALWQERSQFKLPPDDVMQSFPALRVLTQRQHEILYLKGLKQFPDKEFRVIDLSQTLMFCNMVKDKVPCITPAGQKFLTKPVRYLEGSEALQLQGIYLDPQKLLKYSSGFKMDLAGNAFETSCCGAAFLCSLMFCAINRRCGASSSAMPHVPREDVEGQEPESESK